MKIVIPVAGNDWLIHVHADAIEQQGLNPIISLKPLLQSTTEASSGPLLCEEEEESDNEDGNQGRTDLIRALEAPFVPPSNPTFTASQKPFPLPHPRVTSPLGLPAPPHATERSPPVQAPARIPSELREVSQQGGRSGGDQVLNSMESHSETEATTTDEPHVQDRIGSEDAHAAGGRVNAMGREKVLENERERVAQDMDVDQSNPVDKDYDVAKGKDVQDRIGNEDTHVADG